MSSLVPSRLFLLLPLISLASCHCGAPKLDTGGLEPGDADTDVDADTDADTDGDTDTDTGCDDPAGCFLDATITGTVTVRPYTVDTNGDIVLRTWDEIGVAFPFGPIFVASFTEDDGGRTYRGETSILRPSTAPNAYTLHVEGAGFDNVNVYAALDYWNEGVIDGEDPSAAWPEPVEISDGARVPGIDLVILARYDGRNGGGDADVDADGDADGDADADGDTDGDADADRCGISVSGEYDILVAWAGGAVGTMLREPGAARPFRHVVDWSIPSPVAEGAHGAYELGVCKGDGDLDLVAGWDSNGNSLLDPADMWGSYVREPGVDGNPITVGEESLEGYDLEIPTGDGTDPWDFVPFVRISGVVFMEGGFTGVEETARLYVTALKYRPDADITTDDLLEAYDVDTYAYTDLCPTATTCLDDVAYSLVVPASTIVYVWAYLDDDGDGNLNEHGDIIGSIGADEGRIGTGARDSDGMDVLIRRVEE